MDPSSPPYTGPSLAKLRAGLDAYFSWTAEEARRAHPQLPADHPLVRLPPPPPELARFATFAGLGVFWGFLLGGAIGSRSAGLQFLAEHAHQLPVTVQGWYFYHKTKNYRMAWGGFRRGLREAGRLGSVVATFAAVETAVDLARETEDAASSVVAGIFTAAAFAAVNRLPIASAKRTLVYGAATGALVGGIQALAARALGQPVKYAPRSKPVWWESKPNIEEAVPVPAGKAAVETIDL
ncbi:hypothetical protein H9P43_007056 [Blastocladiella emersonii ATCC 22665]|nr:hypothetical protein H9P43_007056 [Blastocladiella emersonii ATCC 22665]